MTQNRKSQCLDTIRQQILSLALPPGSDLDETKLGAEFGISRTPLREVFKNSQGKATSISPKTRGPKSSQWIWR